MDKLWVDKYRPKSLEKLDYHQQLTSMLDKLASQDDFPHLLFYGSNGAGKKTRIMAFLSKVYGKGVYHLKSELREFQVGKSSSTVAECNIVSSNFHLDVTPSDAQNQDKVIIQKLIKESAQTHQLDTKSQKIFKVIIINEVDRLSREAQAALRRTMEKYIAKCRLILSCESLGKVIQPLRSRCLLVRVPAPNDIEMKKVLNDIANNEKIQVPDQLISRIIESNKGNLRGAILSLQSCKMQSYPFKSNQIIPQQEWEKYIQSIAKDILQEQSPQRLKTVRDKIYDLTVNCIPGELIFKKLMYELIIQLPEKVNNKSKIQPAQQEIIKQCAQCENKMQLGSKKEFHLEAFVANAMFIIKQAILQ